MERIAQSDAAQTTEPAKPVRRAVNTTARPAPELTLPTTFRGLWLPPGRGGNPARVALLHRMQLTHGNRATQRLLLDHPASAPIAQRQPGLFDEAKPKGGHHEHFKQMPFSAQKEKRAAALARARQADRERRRRNMRIESPVFPSVTFTVDESGMSEKHRLFVGQVGDDLFQLMIASYPLPVAAFILEMRLRFRKLAAKGQLGNKKLGRMQKPTGEFQVAADAADAELTNANAVFINVASDVFQKLAAEQQLARALDLLIRKVFQIAKRLGDHFANPGYANAKALAKIKNPDTNIVNSSYYLEKLRHSAARYSVEGMVAHYQDLPDYEGSGFERDHQPHNDLIETMALLPAFDGKKLRTVAAGRTLQGWAIMLQHNRHAAGRTFGNKGGIVTGAFNLALANKRGELGLAATDAAIRQFCIDYLVQSMKDDVAAMKAIANNDSQYTDMDAMSPVEKATHRARVKAQVSTGEDQILATEASIRTYDQ